LEIAFGDELSNFEKESNMPYVTSIERLGMKRGLIKGRVEGIEVALQIKFGERGDTLMPEIRAIESVEKLDAVLHAIGGATDPDELRQIWAT